MNWTRCSRPWSRSKRVTGRLSGSWASRDSANPDLFYEFKLTSQSGCLVLEAYSVSHGKATPYLPVIELLKNYFQIKLEDDERTRREKVIGKVLGSTGAWKIRCHISLLLLGISDPTASLDQMDPQIRRQRTFDCVEAVVSARES